MESIISLLLLIVIPEIIKYIKKLSPILPNE